MTTQRFRELLICGCCIAIVIALTTPVLAGTASDHTNATADDTNGLSYNETITLWSGDRDRAITDGQLDTQSALESLVHSTDVAHATPPAVAQTWTRNDFQEWTPGNAQTSRHPPGATLEASDRGWITDAHATQFAQQPATIAFRSDNQRTHYVGQSGTVYGTVDYRIDPPTDSHSPGVRTTYETTSHGVKRVCLLETPARDGASLDDSTCDSTRALATTSTGSLHRSALHYTSDASGGERVSHTFVAEIAITVDVTRSVRVANEVCTTRETPNGTVTDCHTEYHWETQPTETKTDTVHVQERWQGTVYAIERQQVATASYPGADRGVAVTTDLPINGFQYPGGTIATPWHFLTVRDPAWDTIVARTDSGTSTTHSSAHPVRTIAVPAPGGYTARSPGEFSFTTIEALQDTTRRPGPRGHLPDGVQTAVAAEYTDADTIVSKGIVPQIPFIDTSLFGVSEVRISPLVRGAGITAVGGDGGKHSTTIRPTNVSVRTIATDGETARLTLALTDAVTGDPIDLRDRTGRLVVGDQTVQTNASGTAVVTVQRSGYGVVEYQPADWWELGNKQAYAASTARAELGSSALSPLAIVQSLFGLIGLFAIPLLVLAYALDGFYGVDTWPPWRLLSE